MADVSPWQRLEVLMFLQCMLCKSRLEINFEHFFRGIYSGHVSVLGCCYGCFSMAAAWSVGVSAVYAMQGLLRIGL